MLTLGIDPGTTKVGFGLVEEESRGLVPLTYGCLLTKSGSPKESKLEAIYKGLKGLITKYRPSVLAIEKLFFNTNTKTAIAVGEGRGIALLAAAEMDIPVVEYSPLEIKLAITGYGKAEKKQIQHMVKNLLRLPEIPKPDDAADALAVAICHIHSQKMTSKVKDLDLKLGPKEMVK